MAKRAPPEAVAKAATEHGSVSKSAQEELGGGLSASIAEDLAVEYLTSSRVAFEEFGLDSAGFQRAFGRAMLLHVPPAVSGPILKDSRSLSELLIAWSSDPRYLGAKGIPRILSIKGAVPSFECLAQRYLPKLSLAQVTDMAVETADVVRYPKGRIALLGGPFVNVVKSRTLTLAEAVRQVTQLLGTILHNSELNPAEKLMQGWMQRLVIGIMPVAEFPAFMTKFRPLFDEILAKVDAAVEQHQAGTGVQLQGATAVSVGLYVSQEPDWERAGVDPRALLKSSE